MLSCKRPFGHDSGQSLVEYGLVLALVAVVCITGLSTLGQSVNAQLTSLAGAISGAGGGGNPGGGGGANPGGGAALPGGGGTPAGGNGGGFTPTLATTPNIALAANPPDNGGGGNALASMPSLPAIDASPTVTTVAASPGAAGPAITQPASSLQPASQQPIPTIASTFPTTIDAGLRPGETVITTPESMPQATSPSQCSGTLCTSGLDLW